MSVKTETTLLRSLSVLKNKAPFDTGNLRYNAIKLESMGEGVWKMYVDVNVAPYMPYTNEEWKSDKWNGKKNPNEGWFDDAIEDIVRYIATALGAAEIIRR